MYENTDKIQYGSISAKVDADVFISHHKRWREQQQMQAQGRQERQEQYHQQQNSKKRRVADMIQDIDPHHVHRAIAGSANVAHVLLTGDGEAVARMLIDWICEGVAHSISQSLALAQQQMGLEKISEANIIISAKADNEEQLLKEVSNILSSNDNNNNISNSKKRGGTGAGIGIGPRMPSAPNPYPGMGR